MAKYINDKKIQKVFIGSNKNEEIDISFLREILSVSELQISAICKNFETIYDLHPKVLHIQNQPFTIRYERLKENLTDFDSYSFSDKDYKFNCDQSILECKKLGKLAVSNVDVQSLEIIKNIDFRLNVVSLE